MVNVLVSYFDIVESATASYSNPSVPASSVLLVGSFILVLLILQIS